MKGYKGFDKDFKCNGFQYEENKIFTHTGNLELCGSGFHFCENPLDVLKYYPLIGSQFAEVETDGKVIKKEDEDSKVCTDKIHIKAKIDLKAFIGIAVKGAIEFIKEKTKPTSGDSSHSATSGYSSPSATSGDSSPSATSGYSSPSATSGYSSPSATSGDSSPSATSGNYSPSATSGNSSHSATSGESSPSATSGNSSPSATSGYSSPSATSGNSSPSATSGDSSPSATSGNYSPSATSGDSSPSATSGEESIACAIGKDSQAKSIRGNWLVLSEIDDNYHVKCVKTIKVDGKKIKADTWYILKNGKFTEVK